MERVKANPAVLAVVDIASVIIVTRAALSSGGARQP